MKKNNNVANSYSFYTFNKTDIFLDNGENNNSLISDITTNDEQIYVYTYQDDKIIQEYCFVNGNTYLYRKLDNDKLALLYEREQDENGITTISIYNSNTFYNSILKSNKFNTILSMDAKDFLFMDNFINTTSKVPIIKHIGNNLSDKYSNRHLNPIVTDKQFIPTEQNKLLSDIFRKTYMRYNMATNLIPAQCTIKEILRIINHYIATGNLDETNLLTNYIHLQNFQQICSSTIQKLSDFVHNHSSIDLRDLCDFLQNKINNIENLIDMYLSDELEKDSRSL